MSSKLFDRLLDERPNSEIEDAGARTRDSVSCFVTFDGCGVVCVSSDSMLTVFSGVFKAF